MPEPIEHEWRSVRGMVQKWHMLKLLHEWEM